MWHFRHLFVKSAIRGQVSLAEVKKFNRNDTVFSQRLHISDDINHINLTPSIKPNMIDYLLKDMISDYEGIGQNSITREMVTNYSRTRSPWSSHSDEVIDEFELRDWLIFLIDELHARPTVLESSVFHANSFSWEFMKTFIDRNERLSPEHLEFFMSNATMSRFEKLRFSERFHAQRVHSNEL